jgi:hypothetical protein
MTLRLPSRETVALHVNRAAYCIVFWHWFEPLLDVMTLGWRLFVCGLLAVSAIEICDRLNRVWPHDVA